MASFFADQKRNFSFQERKKTKNWGSGSLFKKTENLCFESGDYQIPNSWKEVFKEELKFPANQIALGYEIK